MYLDHLRHEAARGGDVGVCWPVLCTDADRQAREADKHLPGNSIASKQEA